MRLEGKTAAITGGAQGIGLAIAERYIAEGARVAILDVDGEKLGEAEGRLPAGKASAHRLDISKADQVQAAFVRIEKELGGLDILVNNAGVSYRSSFLDMEPDKWERVVAINLTGTFLCGQAAARIMVRRGDGGRIINMVSTSGLRGSSGRSAYGASKGGVVNLTRAMAVELGEHGICVNGIAPGPVLTPMANHDAVQRQAFLDRMALKEYSTPEDIAGAAVFLASDDARMITGHTLSVDGGFNAAGMIMDLSKMSKSAKALP